MLAINHWYLGWVNVGLIPFQGQKWPDTTNHTTVGSPSTRSGWVRDTRSCQLHPLNLSWTQIMATYGCGFVLNLFSLFLALFFPASEETCVPFFCRNSGFLWTATVPGSLVRFHQYLAGHLDPGDQSGKRPPPFSTPTPTVF